MSAPGTRTALLEAAIMDLHDTGVDEAEIARRLDEPAARVRNVVGYMRETSRDRTAHKLIRQASIQLAQAVLATGRTYA